MNSVSSKNASAVRTSSSGDGRTPRRSAVRHRSVISSRSRRRMSCVLVGRQARVVEPFQQRGRRAGAPRAASAGAPRSGGRSAPGVIDRPLDERAERPRSPAVRRDGARPRRRRPNPRATPAAACRSRRRERPHALPLLGQVGELEVEAERPDDALGARRGRGRRARPREPLALPVGSSARRRRRSPPADPLDEVEELGARPARR